MDAATLYTIITLASGQHRTTAREFPSAAQCERAAKQRRMQEPLSSKTQIYCVKHQRPASQNASADLLEDASAELFDEADE